MPNSHLHEPSKYNIGVSLSGGGAKSIAHIGVLQALLENKIEISNIIGTSGGAIIAALYASGLPFDRMIEFVKKGKILSIFKPSFPFTGLSSLAYLEELFVEFKIPNQLEHFNIPFSVGATDLISGKHILFNKGDAYPLIMASCAVPVIFKPIPYDTYLLVDGGVMDNLPIGSLSSSCNYTVGVNVMPSTPQKQDAVDELTEIAFRSANLAMSQLSELHTKEFDLMIRVASAKNISPLAFKEYDSLIEIGYNDASSLLSAIKALPKSR